MKIKKSILLTQAEKNEGLTVQEGSGRFALDPNEESQHHLMSVLTNMYSDPHAATVQETVSNAYDAHKRAGNTTDAVEIYFTTEDGKVLSAEEMQRLQANSRRLRTTIINYGRSSGSAQTRVTLDDGSEITGETVLYFVVQDYGTGMSQKDLETKFFWYGASDKREDSTERGGFGLGCKAGLALLGEIRVSTVKDGIKTEAVGVLNDEENTIDYVDFGRVDEPNGTKVSTPFLASNFQKIIEGVTARRIRLFWEGVPLKVNGTLWEGAESIAQNPTSNGWTQINSSSGRVWFSKPLSIYEARRETPLVGSAIAVNLGGVAYDVSIREPAIREALTEAGFEFGSPPYRIAFDVPLTSLVSLIPSREGILYNDNTISNLVAMIKDSVSAVDTYIKTQVNLYDSPREAAIWLTKSTDYLLKENSGPGRTERIDKIFSEISWRGEKVFVAPDYKSFVSHIFSARTVKSTKFQEHEKWKQRKYPMPHSSVITSQDSVVGHRMVLVSAPQGFRLDKKVMQQVSLAVRSVAGYAKQSSFFSQVEHDVARWDNILFHFTSSPAESFESNNIISSYSKIVSLDELVEEGRRLRALNKAATSKKEDTSNVPRHVVIHSSSRTPQLVSDNFLAGKEIIVITRNVLGKDSIDMFTGAVKNQADSRKRLIQSLYERVVTEMKDKLKRFFELYPDTYFLILPSGRRIGPVCKTFPQAEHLWVRLISDIDLQDIGKVERALIVCKWKYQVDAIRKIAFTYGYSNAEQITDKLLSDIVETDRQTELIWALYSSVVEYDSSDGVLGLIENQDKFVLSLEHFESKADPGSKVNLIEFINSLRTEFGMRFGFKDSSLFRFFEVITIKMQAMMKVIPEKNSSAGLAVSIINSLSS